MKFHFHPDAKEELDGAVEYYEQCQVGLGLEFAEEIYAAIARIIQYPDAWSTLSKNSRRCLVSRFPYGIIYQIKSRTLRIIAVAHLNRRPGYWKERVKQNIGDDVDVTVRDGLIVIAPVRKMKGKHNLQELVAKIPKGYATKEID